jgi:hypothetical protein
MHILSMSTQLQAAELILREALRAVQLQSKFGAGLMDAPPESP